jgi:hypothetical protein
VVLQGDAAAADDADSKGAHVRGDARYPRILQNPTLRFTLRFTGNGRSLNRGLGCGCGR